MPVDVLSIPIGPACCVLRVANREGETLLIVVCKLTVKKQICVYGCDVLFCKCSTSNLFAHAESVIAMPIFLFIRGGRSVAP